MIYCPSCGGAPTSKRPGYKNLGCPCGRFELEGSTRHAGEFAWVLRVRSNPARYLILWRDFLHIESVEGTTSIPYQEQVRTVDAALQELIADQVLSS